ncbi:hypothetical protein OSB04_006445 [Centaurea solstitialis]|uniref:GAG-pre-integrase domain-containing protein n=1 Tax=Centaurea solstitialis TaxID=347529 RepID=A0AA38THX8_9ASTR|nr:hypothetical protein OSB04_006445 [Centaurea solstitialis]
MSHQREPILTRRRLAGVRSSAVARDAEKRVPKKNKRFRKTKNTSKPKKQSDNFHPRKNASNTHSHNVNNTNRGSPNMTDNHMRQGRHRAKESGSKEGNRLKPFAHKPRFTKNNFSKDVFRRTNRHVPRTPFQCYDCEHVVYGCHSNFRYQNQFRFGYRANAFVNDYFAPNFYGFYNNAHQYTPAKTRKSTPKRKSPKKNNNESKPTVPNKKGPIPKWVPKNDNHVWYMDSGSSKHMTERKALFANFKNKYGRNVRFGNKLSAPIMGYRDILHEKITINKVAYVEGLSHNLINIKKFSDKGLEVNFRETKCSIKTLEGKELIRGTHKSNLYTINFQNYNVLWHRRLSHLNYPTINQLAKAGLVTGLPSLKFTKEQLYSTCEMGKIKEQLDFNRSS